SNSNTGTAESNVGSNGTGHKPMALPVRADHIPACLRGLARWVVWRYVLEVCPKTGEADWSKPPVNARSGGLASSTNPKTWSAFADALAAYRRGGLDGVGLVLHRDREADGPGLVGIDLDHCRDRDTGVIAPWALAVIKELDSYTEVSPSG